MPAFLPVRPSPTVPLWSWTGFYFGSHIGEAWARKNWQNADGFFGPAGPFGADFIPFAGAGTSGGVFGGLQAGYNLQYGPVVWGLELEGSTADLDGNARCAVASYLCNSRIDYMGTLTGRVGYAFGHTLLYVKGGGAYAHDKYLMTSFGFPQVFNANDNRFGWTAGIGVEYAFTPAWSTKLEFDYISRLRQRLHHVHRASARLLSIQHCDRPDGLSPEGRDQLQVRLEYAGFCPAGKRAGDGRYGFLARGWRARARGARMDDRSRCALLVQRRPLSEELVRYRCRRAAELTAELRRHAWPRRRGVRPLRS